MKNLKHTWTMNYQDWLELGQNKEVYNDVKMGVKAGESYVVKDLKGMFAGTVSMDSHEELMVTFQKA